MRKFLITLLIFTFTLFVFSNIPLSIGTIEKNNEKYFVYELTPEFSFGTLTLGIGFTAYATDVVYGELYYGIPSSTPSTNIINAFVLNTLGIKTDNFGFRYGLVKPTTLALGFNMRKYINRNTRAFDLKFNLSNFGLYTHIPYEITKFVPFEVLQSDSVFFGDFVYKAGFVELQVYGITDTEATDTFVIDNSTPVKYAGGVAIYVPLVNVVKLGVEFALQSDESFSSIGNGVFVGVYGDFGVLEPVGGVYYFRNGYVPFLFDRNYNYLKSNQSLNGLENVDDKSGYLVGMSVDLMPYGNGEFYVYGALDGVTPVAEGNVRIILPEIASFPGLFIDGYYYDSTPFENGFLDENTEVYLKISYPILGESFVAGIVYSWEENQWAKSLFIGGLTTF
ncbi:hypothetical protein XJ44_08060 [Thermosipho affectus]|uniref:Uncharacterized protein n=1 Tax=Thermosipho affectus TaxID=660294 RepID=A0ABX3IG58_9BACT|nr:hypothetical protein [Thermosipho affectus]ONN26808.1 hypothetical protein XJ44_08060 [Thermosipho affectus]